MMDKRKVGVAIIATALTAESFLRHDEAHPHTHSEVEPPFANLRVGVSVYGIQNSQFAIGKTFVSFPTANIKIIQGSNYDF